MALSKIGTAVGPNIFSTPLTPREKDAVEPSYTEVTRTQETSEDLIKKSEILIVDDEIVNVRLLERTLLRWGYVNVKSTTQPREVAQLVEETQFDLILLDLMMPEIDGFEILSQLRPHIVGTYLPVMVLTADATPQTKKKALAAGAKDFLSKPFDVTELLLRVFNLLETRQLHCQLSGQNDLLEAKVQERTHELHESQIEVIERLAQAAEFRDDDTGQHTYRVGALSATIARELLLDEEKVNLIHRAAPLHDVGKIGISDQILLKPGKLTDDEFATMKQHTTIGANLLANGHSALMHIAEKIALSHHERWTGGGYPQGISGEDIPLVGRIVAVADVFDALTNERPYKKAWPVAEAISEINSQSGKQFDPSVIKAFEQALQKLNLAEPSDKAARH